MNNRKINKHIKLLNSKITGFLILIVIFIALPKNSFAVTTTCDVYTGDNTNSQNYYIHDSVVPSYLTTDGNGGLMRVQSDAVDGKILVEYYDINYNIQSTRLIDYELPIFGAFYETDYNYYILSGQSNPNESDNVEVFRLTKYDKNWARISSCSLYGANTYIPFDAGSARITTSGSYMLIRTAHEMYMSDDGYHHQANVTIEVNMDTMTITDSYTNVMNSGYGYISHSFNQFIRTDGNNIVAVDHGDAYPRSIVLTKYNTDFTTGTFTPGYYSQCDVVDLYKFSGNCGENYTGATVGGFELSSSSYIVAGTSVDQINNYNGSTRNVFVVTATKNTGSGIGTPVVKWLTNYEEGEDTARTPHLVKINDNKFIILWTYGDTIYYTQLDASGNLIGQLYSFEGALSDCVPLQYNNKLIWYTWKNEKVTFYEISLSDFSKNNKVIIKNGHDLINYAPSYGSNIATQVCSKCGHTQQLSVPTSYSIWWRNNSENYYYSSYSTEYYVGDKLDIWVSPNSSSDNSDIVIEVSDSSIASLDYPDSYSRFRSISMNKVGSFTVTIYPRFNPNVKEIYNFKVVHKYSKSKVVSPTYTSKGYTIYKCDICGETHTTDYVNKLKLAKVNSLKQATSYSTTSITMSWNKVNDATGYEVYKATSKNGTYSKVKITTDTSYKNGGLKSGTVYYYKIRAYKTDNAATIYSDFSPVIAMGTKTATVTSLAQITPHSTTSITMSWNSVSGAKGYEVYRATSKNGKYSKVKTTTSTSFKQGKLTRGKTYYYKVRAYKTVNGSKIYGKFSSVKAMGTKPQTPIIELRSGNSKAKVIWKKITGISGYEVYMSTSSSGTYSKIKTSGSKNTAYLKTGLASGKKYYFKVRSYRTVGGKKIYSSWCTIKSVTVK